MLARPSVTLVVPTRNGGAEFQNNLRAMLEQRLDRSYEVLVIDSGSTDGTIEFLRRQPVRLVQIPAGDFNHGRTRALAVREASGDVVVFTVQDATPVDRQWIQALVNALDDPRVAGAYSRQLPRPDATPFVRERLNRWVVTSDTARRQVIDNLAEFESLDPLQRFQQIVFDNVSSAVRRLVALDIPFRDRRFGEDLDWSHRVLLAGHAIVYEPASCVIHSHDRSFGYEFKRAYLTHQHLRDLLQIRLVPTAVHVGWFGVGRGVRLAATVATDSSMRWSTRLQWMVRATPYSFAEALAQYLGGRASCDHLKQSPLSRWIDRRLSGGV